jgi:REP element-mobilizing transposase RayT
MAYVKNWLHCVWGTKNRQPYLAGGVKGKVIEHIKTNAKEKGIYIDIINGHHEHIHCLISLDPEMSLSKVIQLIKGESSFWINRNKLTKLRFEWADEYYAVSVSESDVPKVRRYIDNQEEHHRIKSWDDEYREFLKEYGFDKFPG